MKLVSRTNRYATMGPKLKCRYDYRYVAGSHERYPQQYILMKT
jgi:hypothetical protein